MFRTTRIITESLARRSAKPMLSTLVTHRRKLSNPESTNILARQSQSLLSIGTHERVVLSRNELNSGYNALHQRLNSMISQAVIAACVSPTISAIWLLATEQMLLESPVAIASLLTGGAIVAERMMQYSRVRKYAQLSTMTSLEGPALSSKINTKVQQIIAGDNPKVKFAKNGLTISGPIGDLQNPSQAAEDARIRARAMKRVVIPSCTLTNKTSELTDLAFERWMSRINYPFAIFNLITIMNKDSKDRRADDYVVAASSMYNIYDFFNGPSVAEAREKFAASLKSCRTPQEVIQVLVDNEILDQGGMSFLNEWVKDQNKIGVRIGRTGTPILYSETGRTSSFCGPFPMQLFPKQRTIYAESAASAENIRLKKH